MVIFGTSVVYFCRKGTSDHIKNLRSRDAVLRATRHIASLDRSAIESGMGHYYLRQSGWSQSKAKNDVIDRIVTIQSNAAPFVANI